MYAVKLATAQEQGEMNTLVGEQTLGEIYHQQTCSKETSKEYTSKYFKILENDNPQITFKWYEKKKNNKYVGKCEQTLPG